MIHNGISSRSPYFEDAKNLDIRIYGNAFVWTPQGSSESWLIPPEWVSVTRKKKTGEIVSYTIEQPGCINNQIIDAAEDRVEIFGNGRAVQPGHTDA